jgi:hypothetical protein
MVGDTAAICMKRIPLFDETRAKQRLVRSEASQRSRSARADYRIA